MGFTGWTDGPAGGRSIVDDSVVVTTPRALNTPIAWPLLLCHTRTRVVEITKVLCDRRAGYGSATPAGRCVVRSQKSSMAVRYRVTTSVFY